MSTATIDPNVTTNASDVLNESYTLVCVSKEVEKEVEENGVKKTVTETKKFAYPESEDLDKKIADGEFKEEFRQSFNHPTPQTLEAAKRLISNEDELLNLIQKALTVKLQNKSRTTVLGKEFTPVDGVIDLTEYANEVSERRMSPFQKTLKSIEDFDENTRNALLQALLKMQQSQPTA